MLYLSYDGMCDPLGASQVLPYLTGLAGRGHRISLVSFEKPERTIEERTEVQRTCANAGIAWHPLAYHKRPPVVSTIYDLVRMWRLARSLHKTGGFDLVHCRGYIPALVGLRMKQLCGVKFLFDMRGFWADERREGGAWSDANPLYRSVYSFFKRREREFWVEADEVVSLTKEGQRVVEAVRHGPIAVIPCCVDFDAFAPAALQSRSAARAALGIADSDKVLGYIGSLGGNYMLGEMLDFFGAYRRRFGATKFLFVTHVPAALIQSAAAAKGIPDSAIVIRSASHREVPRLMAAADHGIAFKQPSFSAKACSPTKLGEMLALEVPMVANAGVGDVAAVIEETGAGVLVAAFDDASYRRALEELDGLKPDMVRWRAASRRWFDLETGVERYDALYTAMAAAA